MTRGAICHQQAYAQGKMLDHSGWSGLLERKITPSDIDMVVESGGYFVFAELSSRYASWREISIGQRRLYHSLIVNNPGRHVCVLLKHSVKSSRQIRTDKDIDSASLWAMDRQAEGRIDEFFVSLENCERWRRMLAFFVKEPKNCIEWIKRLSSQLDAPHRSCFDGR